MSRSFPGSWNKAHSVWLTEITLVENDITAISLPFKSLTERGVGVPQHSISVIKVIIRQHFWRNCTVGSVFISKQQIKACARKWVTAASGGLLLHRATFPNMHVGWDPLRSQPGFFLLSAITLRSAINWLCFLEVCGVEGVRRNLTTLAKGIGHLGVTHKTRDESSAAQVGPTWGSSEGSSLSLLRCVERPYFLMVPPPSSGPVIYLPHPRDWLSLLHEDGSAS